MISYIMSETLTTNTSIHVELRETLIVMEPNNFVTMISHIMSETLALNTSIHVELEETLIVIEAYFVTNYTYMYACM